jgi:hypothetical protein
LIHRGYRTAFWPEILRCFSSFLDTMRRLSGDR